MGKATEKRKSKIFLKVILIIVIVLIAMIVSVCIWQKDNIKAVAEGMQYSQDELAEKITQSKDQSNKALQQYNTPVIRDFTLEEEEKIRKGEMTVEEAVSKIMKEETQSSDDLGTDVAENDSGNIVSEKVTDVNPVDQVVGKYVTEMYSLKAYYLGQLGALEKSMKAEYKSLGTGDKGAGISKVLKNNLSNAAKMESECDAKVETVLSNMENELTALSADTAIVETMREAYISEKSLRKSYYLSLYNN